MPSPGRCGPLADVHDKATRSRNMAAIRGRDTGPERIIRRGLHARGLRFRLHAQGLPGRPDLIFPGRRLALFVHGCFWHAHQNCTYFRMPQTNARMWKTKLDGNRQRDERDQAALRALGWRVVIVWECQLRDRTPDEIANLLDGLAAVIKG
jgi:DNA mismatch endonuclease, patch repair protein